MVKDKNHQIDHQTKALLEKGGLSDQVEKSRDQLLQGKKEGRRQKQIHKIDYNEIKNSCARIDQDQINIK
jgi:hypothetical protein|tara:strand:- start:777 stop:986 length:210 start_codon:yes stop_codon:yes gene_type:complete